jgi:hypothetical protein
VYTYIPGKAFFDQYLSVMDDILKLLKSGIAADEVLAFSLLATKDKQYFKSLVAELKKKNYSLYLIEKTEELSRLAR